MGEEGGGEDAIVGGEMGVEVGTGGGVATEHPLPLPLHLLHFFFFTYFISACCSSSLAVFLPSSPTRAQFKVSKPTARVPKIGQ